MRKVFDFLVFLLFVYGIFVTIDCFRLKAADDLKRPFVILKSEEEVDTITFKSLGYKMVYKVDKKQQSGGIEMISANEGAFILFDTFTLWTKNYNQES